MSLSYRKVKNVGKSVLTRQDGGRLESVVNKTMRVLRDIVGGTLGPGGQPVLIERQEDNMPPIVTKDGVTVFRHMGFENPTAEVVLEAARDAAVRTASEAGDGTTTATVLSEAIVRLTKEYCAKHKDVSPQKVVRRLQSVFAEIIEPTLKSLAIQASVDDEAGKQLLFNVARISANGDVDLAKSVMDCFDIVGDAGNVTITEVSGPYGYEVEKVDGYPIPNMGFEDSLGKYSPGFITDQAGQRVWLDKPLFVVFHGKITEVQSMRILMEKVFDNWQAPGAGYRRHNVVIVATGFSDSVVGQLCVNMMDQSTINVLPLTAPLSPVPGGQLALLEDLCAFTGARLLDPLSNPLDAATLEDCGTYAKGIEMTRFRTTVFPEDPAPLADANGNLITTDKDEVVYGDMPNSLTVGARIDILEQHLKQAASELDAGFINERIGKLTGGIARLKVVGSSSGENRERRDRAEDAVCSVRGTIKHGCLPGGGWGLMRAAHALDPEDPVCLDVLKPALLEPVRMLFTNCGYTEEETTFEIAKLLADDTKVFDLLKQEPVDAQAGGLLDSLPAVLEAVRNSLSIASLLGTLGGTIVFARDTELERSEAKETRSFLRDGNEVSSYVEERPM